MLFVYYECGLERGNRVQTVRWHPLLYIQTFRVGIKKY